MRYIAVGSKPELEGALAEAVKEGRRFAIIAGGTDLMVYWKSNRPALSALEEVIDVSGVREMVGIRDEGGSVFIGASTVVEEIRASDIVRKWAPALSAASERFATLQVRNVATIGGNLGTASPASTLAPALLVHEAEVVIGPGSRAMSLRGFFRGPKRNALGPGEYIEGVRIRKEEGIRGAYEEVGKREGNIIAIANAAVALRVEGGTFREIRVALGSVSPTPVRAPTLESALSGRPVEEAESKAPLVRSDISPITDFRASREYRLAVAPVIVRRAIRAALGDA